MVIPFGVPPGRLGLEVGGMVLLRPGAFIICCWLGTWPERCAARLAYMGDEPQCCQVGTLTTTHPLLRNHLLAVLFLPFLQLHLSIVLQPAELGWGRDRRLGLVSLISLSQ